MQKFMDTLRRTGGLEALARRSGLSTPATRQSVEALLPFVLGGFKRLSLAAGKGDSGQADLEGRKLCEVVESHGGAEMAAAVMGEASLAEGEALLAETFGGEEALNAVCSAAAGKVDVPHQTLRAMLPAVAMLTGGYAYAIYYEQPEGEETVNALLGLDVAGNPLDSVLPA